MGRWFESITKYSKVVVCELLYVYDKLKCGFQFGAFHRWLYGLDLESSVRTFESCHPDKSRNAQKWYSSVSTGCDTYTNLYKDLKFGKTLAPTAAIAVGRDHNPYLGTRLEVRVGNALFSDGENIRMNTPFLMSFADMTCNLTNVVCGLNNRIYDVIIFGGAGDVYNFKNSTYDMKSLNCFALRYGISCDVYVYNNDKLTLFVEPTFNVNNYLIDKKFTSDYILNLSIGVLVKL